MHASLLHQLGAVGDSSRLKLLAALGGEDELCVCDLMAVAGLSQPLTSHHLRVLREAGLVERRRQGTWFYYRQNARAVAELVAGLGQTLNAPSKAVRASDGARGPRLVR